jgi:CubicO group peptidase (beta-lactamase class C family)
MKRSFLLIILWFSAGHLTAQTTYSKEIEAQIKQVENNLSARVKIDSGFNVMDRLAYYNVKGLTIAVIQNHQVIWAKGYGWADEKEKRPVTTETLFKPGSISKSLNAVGVLKLVQDNKLSLSKDINEYLKSWKFPYDSVSKGKKITLAHLLSHTGGLSVYGGFPGYDRKGKIPTLPEILDGKDTNVPPVRSLFEPGLKYEYSGGGITVSQLIITDVTQQPYEKFMYDSVLKPLGMTHSFYSTEPLVGDKRKNLATGYRKNGTEADDKFEVYPEQAAMGLWTTPAELGKYVVEIQLAYEGKSSKILNKEMARLHLTPYIDESAAMGTFVQERNGAKYFFHDAANEGFRGFYIASLEGGNGFAGFVNSDDGNIVIELMNSVAEVYNWKGFDKPVTVKTKKVQEATTKKYIGVYLFEGRIAEVTKKQDGLYFWSGGQDVKMYFTSDKDFINVEFPSEKSFIVDSTGNVTGYTRKVDGKEYPSAIKITHVDTLKANNGELNSFGRHLLETKRYDEAIVYLGRAIELEPQDIPAQGNLAHSYLFKNDYDKAVKLYRDILTKEVVPGSPFREILKQDFVLFKNNGFDKSLMDKVFADLKLAW